jgi:RNA polymerase sigma-70 factor (ECF subfamily)
MLPRKRIQRHLSPVQEAQLVERLRTGDRSAQAEVVRRYRRMLLHQAFAVVHQWPLAEDAVQDTWILAFRNIERFEGRSMLRTWLAGIAINQARKYRRQGRRSPQLSAVLGRSRDPAAPVQVPASPSFDEPANEVTAEHLVLAQERGHELKAALRRLPVTQRSVLLLELRGYSPAETRSTLRITEVARRVRLSRARARLRKLFRWDVRSRSPTHGRDPDAHG